MAETGRTEDAAPPVGRRTFVKGVVAGAAVGAAGAAGVAVWRWGLGDPGVEKTGPGRLRYAGARVLPGSPTDLGVPIIDLGVDSAGYLRAKVQDLGPFLYCARRGDATLDDIGDRYLRYYISDEKLVRGGEDPRRLWWYHDLRGERIHVDHFADRARLDGAVFAWGDAERPTPFTGVLVKLARSDIVADGEAGQRVQEATDAGYDLVAFDAACTHFCCTAGWHEDATAERYGAWDTIFCTCHNARFDPTRVEMYAFDWAPAATR